METHAVVLCRRDLSDFGAAPRYCSKSIKSRNALNWCPDCRERLPIWPTEALKLFGAAVTQEVK